MTKIQPNKLLIVAFVLLLIGVVLPFLMVIKIIENSFLISFISYASSISGMVIGTIGVMMLSAGRRKRD
jgi:type IV secretory pathway TrbL component